MGVVALKIYAIIGAPFGSNFKKVQKRPDIKCSIPFSNPLVL